MSRVSNNKDGRAIWMRITAGLIVETLSTICISSKFLLMKEFFIIVFYFIVNPGFCYKHQKPSR
jgi:hypothetical protein